MSEKKNGAVRTLISSMQRNAKLSTSMSFFIVDQFRSIRSESIKRRKSSYSVDPEIGIDEFRKCLSIFRFQISIYILVIILSITLCIFGVGGLLTWVVCMYASMMYIIYIRDLQRARLLLRRWDLRTTSLPLTWKRFFAMVMKNPKCLLPFGE